MSNVVIEAQDLGKRYGAAKAVANVSFSVSQGEIFGLLGPNGAGKTTTILMLLGLTEISSGRARVFGHDPARAPLAVKRLVGYMPDSVGFYDHLTAADNLHFTARLMGFSLVERKNRIRDALARVGLAEVADNKVGTFSRGMRQRLGLAEIVVKGARAGILDEPTNGLDPQASLDLLDLIRTLKAQGVTILLSSHLLDRVQSVCDRVALFSAGHIALTGTVSELGRQVLGGGYVVEVEANGGSGITERLSALDGVRSVLQPAAGRWRMDCERDLRPEVAAAVVAAEGSLYRLSLDEPNLETIYTRYFQKERVAHAA
jgi:ABC-2 type transport system ATP-binding protein